MAREIKYKPYFDDSIDEELEEIQVQCEEIEAKLESFGERLEKISHEIYEDRYACHKELYSKLNSKAYELQYKCDWSDWLKTFRRDPHK